MPHIKHAGWYSESGKPVFCIKLESVESGVMRMWFGRVPAWSCDQWTIGHVKLMATDVIEGKTAVVYIISHGDVTRNQTINIITESLAKYRLSAGKEY